MSTMSVAATVIVGVALLCLALGVWRWLHGKPFRPGDDS